MAKIVLIGCTKSKRPKGNEYIAKELYDVHKSSFPIRYQYAKLIQPFKILILSAEYHVMDTEDEVTKYKHYNTTLSDVSPKKRTLDLKILSRPEKIEWAKTVLKQLNTICDLSNDDFIFMLSKSYYENIILEKQCDEVKIMGLYINKYKFPSETWSHVGDIKQRTILRTKIKELKK